MAVTTVSAKGQVVIPKAIRDALALRPGTRLVVSVEDGTVMLKPVGSRPEASLYGKYKGMDLLADLRDERRREKHRMRTRT